MLKKLSVFVICLVGLTACGTSSNYKPEKNPVLLLKPKMTKQEVISILGEPYRKEASKDFERYTYTDSKRTKRFYVRFDENGKLTDAYYSK